MRDFRLAYVNLYCIIKDLLVNFWLVLLCGAIGWMGTQIILENIYQPEYTSSAVYFISPKDSTGSAYSNISAGNQLAGVLRNVFSSQIMAQKAAEAMGRGELPARVDAQIVEYTNLLRLSATGDSPEAAFRTIRAIMQNHFEVSGFVADNMVAEVLESPLVPVNPSNYIPLRSSQKTAAIAAMVLAAAAIIALSILRDTVKTEAAAKNLVDAPLYGVLKHEAKNKTLRSFLHQTNKALLITNPVTSFQYTEAIKRITTKMEYAAGLRNEKIFLIASAGENEGKSSIAANLAVDLASRGNKVLLVDGDLRRPAQFKIFDKRNGIVCDYADYLRGKAELSGVLHLDVNTGLYMLLNTHSYKDSAELIASEKMKTLIETVRNMMDYIIVDSVPMVLTADAEELAALCDTSLLALRQDYTYIRVINDTIDKLSENSNLLGTIFNASRTLKPLGVFSERKYSRYYK